MARITQNNNKTVIKGNIFFLFSGIFTIPMAISGIHLIIDSFPFEDGYESFDIFGLVFLCIWTLIILGMSIYSFETFSKKTVIDRDGVSCKSLFKSISFNWYEIADYGLSYCGQAKGEGNTYYLYFSKEQQQTKNECKKKLKGKMIKIEVFGDEYYEILEKVIPFCQSCAKAELFIGKDKYHII